MKNHCCWQCRVVVWMNLVITESVGLFGEVDSLSERIGSMFGWPVIVCSNRLASWMAQVNLWLANHYLEKSGRLLSEDKVFQVKPHTSKAFQVDPPYV